MTENLPVIPTCCSAGILVAAGTSLPELCTIQHAILENAGHSIIATDRDGTILYFNRTAQRLLGYNWHDVVGRATPALFHLADEISARALALSSELGREVEIA